MKAVQTLSACNAEGSPLKSDFFDLKFVRMMVISLYDTEELTANIFPQKKQDFMQRLFAIRVGGQAERNEMFQEYFEMTLKEALVRNSKNRKKLEQIQLPDHVSNRKK